MRSVRTDSSGVRLPGCERLQAHTMQVQLNLNKPMQTPSHHGVGRDRADKDKDTHSSLHLRRATASLSAFQCQGQAVVG